MLWVYVLVTTVGIVGIVPAVLRNLDGVPSKIMTGFIGFTCTFAGLTGLFCRQVGVDPWTTLVAASALGLAAGALHPELMSMLKSSTGSPPTQSTSAQSPSNPAAAAEMAESRHDNS